MHGVIHIEDASSRCIQRIRERCDTVIHQLETTLRDDQVQITGVIGSWHGKQQASEAARSLFPDRRICNKLEVVKLR